MFRLPPLVSSDVYYASLLLLFETPPPNIRRYSCYIIGLVVLSKLCDCCRWG